MRVVAGELRGRRLLAPPGRGTRPTSDRVREAIFSVLGSLPAGAMVTLEGARVADLFAGSGAMGIEALSRGAAHVTFVDHDRAAVATIRDNLARVGLAGPRATVVPSDVLRWLPGRGPFDVVLADPPYAYAAWPLLVERLAPVTGVGVFESGAPLALGPEWEVLREKHYGGTVVTVARPAPDRKGDA